MSTVSRKWIANHVQWAYEPRQANDHGWVLDPAVMQDRHGWPHGAVKLSGGPDYPFLVQAPLTLAACGIKLTVAKDHSIQLVKR